MGTSTLTRKGKAGLYRPQKRASSVRPDATVVRREATAIFLGDAKDLYHKWPKPTLIISDGPYGLGSYPGDPPTVEALHDFYRPHLEAWGQFSLPSTTLWFWNSELGWATVHHLIEETGWEFRNCHIWNKGTAHIAGNANSKTLRKFPVVTEVCVQYVRKVSLPSGNRFLSLKDWLRHEWERSGLPLYRANEASGVVNAATRKYLTKDHLWYFPPPEAFERLVRFVNKHGSPRGRPYFSIDGIRPLSATEWGEFRAKFHCLFGVNNVWSLPPVNGEERIRDGNAAAHLNQKPLALMEIIVTASSDPGDVVWEPFGGTCTAAVASLKTKRRCYSAEILPRYFRLAARRLGTFKWTEQLRLPE
jgi:site-specific DNA-methyltransferase (adenine-specific)